MPPYRARRDKPRERPEPKAGLVSDMVRQFADPYAFLRELVQNSMDAEATRIQAVLTRSSDDRVTTAVSDDGSGMNPSIIENLLLTLFSSSKENDSTKIGKYGVGFISVLAIEPESVIVDTWRDGAAWRARISADQTWVIEEAGPKDGHGTTVTLEGRMPADAFATHVQKARAALLRWCRHAAVPISFSATDFSLPEAALHQRIDTPISLHAVASVTEVDGDDVIVVAPATAAERLPRPEGAEIPELSSRFVGFYNRGLTLYETTTELFAGLEDVLVKISSPALKHTLSRDNVRRDGRFAELVASAKKLARDALPEAVERSLRAQAAEVSSGKDASLFVALLLAAASGPAGLAPKQTWFPLSDAIEGHAALTAHEIVRRTPRRSPVLTAVSADPLTAAFAKLGRPVVLCPSAEVAIRLTALSGRDVSNACEPAHEAHVLASELPASELSAGDLALAKEVLRLLAGVGQPVAGISFATTYGARPGPAVIARERASGILSREEMLEASSSWRKGSTLLLDVREQAVSLARQHARTRLAEAAHLLTRVLLLDRGGVPSRKLNRALLADYAGGSS